MKDEHDISYKTKANNDVQAECSCGAKWSHPSNATVEQLEDTYQAHLNYFNKPATVVL